MSIDTLRNQFLALVVVTAFMIAQPEFASSEGPSEHSGFYVKLEGRYVISRGDETPYAVNVNGRVHDIGLNHDDASVRYGIGYRMGKWDFGLHYSGLKIRGNDRANGCSLRSPRIFGCGLPDPIATPISYPLIGNAIGGGNLLTYLVGPLKIYGAGFIAEDADYNTTYHVVDFEAGYTINLGQTEVRAIAGIRYAHFNQNILARGILGVAYSIDDSPVYFVYNFDTSRSVSNWGIGPLLGAEVNHPLFGGFSLSGSVRGSALFGERDTVDGFRVFLAQVKGNIGDDDSFFWNAEGDLGLSYGVELGNASSMLLTVGYRAEAWFDVNNTSSNGFLSPGLSFGEQDADQFFHGPFMRAVLNF